MPLSNIARPPASALTPHANLDAVPLLTDEARKNLLATMFAFTHGSSGIAVQPTLDSGAFVRVSGQRFEGLAQVPPSFDLSVENCNSISEDMYPEGRFSVATQSGTLVHSRQLGCSSGLSPRFIDHVIIAAAAELNVVHDRILVKPDGPRGEHVHTLPAHTKDALAWDNQRQIIYALTAPNGCNIELCFYYHVSVPSFDGMDDMCQRKLFWMPGTRNVPESERTSIALTGARCIDECSVVVSRGERVRLLIAERPAALIDAAGFLNPVSLSALELRRATCNGDSNRGTMRCSAQLHALASAASILTSLGEPKEGPDFEGYMLVVRALAGDTAAREDLYSRVQHPRARAPLWSKPVPA